MILLNGNPLTDADLAILAGQNPDHWHEPYCEVCRRVTDHVAEHDVLVDLGVAVYRAYGDVRVTEFGRWFLDQPDLIQAVQEIEDERYVRRVHESWIALEDEENDR